ncbi:MAG: tRNA pseudouridine(38-40) synthase TruA [Clostridia bacterium]|nr:tRNA pseudouridine(38-40) synthase TruA [Clostridia bacterium]
MIIAYDGTNYVGWQTQPNGVSVQETIERALREVAKENIDLQGSGRTDSGVHAAAQVAHFDTNVRMAADKFAIALNMHLPPDIRVLYSEECDTAFHSRFSAKKKQYRYRIHIGPHADVFSRNTALQLYRMPDLSLLNHAAAQVLGTHDFRAFMSSGTHMENTIRTIEESVWTWDGTFLIYSVTGNGFLYNMVRILVGTMLEIGFAKLPEDTIQTALLSQDRSAAGPTAPAHGLLLNRVIYEDFDTAEVRNRER